MTRIPGPYLFAPYPGNPANPFGPMIWHERLPDAVIGDRGYAGGDGDLSVGRLVGMLGLFALGHVLFRLDIDWGFLIG